MKLSLAALLVLATGLIAAAQSPSPRLTTVDPPNGKAGDVITVAGENVGKAQVAKLYLTDGKNDVTLVMTEQTDTSLKFKIPEKTAAGRFALMLLTTGKEPKLIEQPVKLTVEE